MNLSAPMFLAALGLLVPILITFLVRRQRNVVRVPSTMVWRLGARSITKNRRLRDLRRLLALFACLLGVAALVVAAARPSGERGGTTVYVVDVSSSMEGAPLAEARGWLVREVAALGANARVAIVLAGDEPRVLLPPTPPGARVDEAIAKIAAEKGTGGLDEAIGFAEALAGVRRPHFSPDPPPRVVVLSDHPLETTDSAASLDADAGATAKTAARASTVVHLVTRTKNDNVGITGMSTRTPPDAHDDEEREAAITIATSSTVARRARLDVALAGRPLAQRRIEIVPGGESTERVVLRGGGRLVARVVPEDGRSDALAIDDEVSLEEVERRPPRVALLRTSNGDDHRSAGAFFVEKALRAAGVTELGMVEGAGEVTRSKFDVAVLVGDCASRPIGVPMFLVGSCAPDEMTTRSVKKTETHLRTIVSEEAILRGVAFDDLTTLRANVATHLPRDARVLVDLDGGPTLAFGGAGARAWVWLGIDPDGSDLVLRVAFPVLVGNVLSHLGGSSQVVTAKAVPRAEVMLASTTPTTPLPASPDPRWRAPATPAMAVAAAGALLLLLEAWLSFRRAQPKSPPKGVTPREAH